MNARVLAIAVSLLFLAACSEQFKADPKLFGASKNNTTGYGGTSGSTTGFSGSSTGGTSGATTASTTGSSTTSGSTTSGTTTGSSTTSGTTTGSSTTSGSTTGGSSGNTGCSDPQVDAFCRAGGQPPNVQGIIEELARQYPGELSRCARHNYEFSHIVANYLRANVSTRWGLNWVRGNYGDETGDTLGYYYGPGEPQNNSTFTVVIDYIGGCDGPDERIYWGAYVPESYSACCNPPATARWTIEPLGGGSTGSGGTGACLGSGGQVRNGYPDQRDCNLSWSNDPQYTPCYETADSCWKPKGF